MKRFFTKPISLAIAFLIAIASFANTVVVKGTVKYSNGNVVANKAVKIWNDSLNTPSGCYQVHYKYTNSAGQYQDTISCSATNIATIYTSTENCNGGSLLNTNQVGTNTLVESNFTICSPQPYCLANFVFGVTNLIANFSSTSIPSSGTNIIGYSWNFGDGTTSSVANPSHTYATAGAYNVRLTIASAAAAGTVANCYDSVTKVVLVQNVVGTCHADFNSTISGFGAAFNSTPSTTAPGDSIRERNWTFGDGQSVGGNIVIATHSYNANGVYTVCLKTTTWGGCKDSICKVITIANTTPPTTCAAVFNFAFLQGRTFQFYSSASVGANSNDAIVKRKWVFGDGTQDTTNIVSPIHSYANYGVYTVCLTIKTAAGCEKTVCNTVVVSAPVICHAAFTITPLSPTAGLSGWSIKFNSNISTTNDSIVERRWTWGDGTTTTGNLIDPTHTYTANGTYTVCLKIRSATGCTDSTCSTIIVPFTNQLSCTAYFTFTPVGQLVKFNGRPSVVPAGDSIIQYKWEYGDGQVQTGLYPEPQHQYAQTGLYNVCLTIRTTRGCESKICKQVVVPQVTYVQCVPHFTFERVTSAPRTIRFNSATSWIPTNDSITERKWTFGDGTAALLGNTVNPLHQYATAGIYTVCLRIKTALGCVNEFCQPISVDSGYVTPPNAGLVKIISLYPNPCTVQLSTVVWSGVNNLSAQLAIYDVYGVRKWSVQKTLLAGNNYTILPTVQLASGPYFFRVTTMYGVQSKPFYKF